MGIWGWSLDGNGERRKKNQKEGMKEEKEKKKIN